MNVSIEINWKTIAAGGIAVTSCILVKRIDKDDAKELLNTMITTTINTIGFKKDGYIANRRLNKDGTYSGVEYFSKTK